MSSYEPGDRLRNPDTNATFRVIKVTDHPPCAVFARNERTGNPAIIAIAAASRFERVESR